MGTASDDMLGEGENALERRRREKQESDERAAARLSISRKGVSYNIDKNSSVSAKASLGIEDGKLKLRRFGIEYRKEF